MKTSIITFGICLLFLLLIVHPMTLGLNIFKERVSDNSNKDLPWPMYCHDTKHTGRSQYSTSNNPFEEKWWFKTTYEEDNYWWDSCYINIAKDGTIYFTDIDGYIYALYPDGTLKWKFDVFDVIECHPAIDNNGTIYFGTYYYDFYAVNPNGTLKWKYIFPPKVHVFSSPAIGEDGTIYFGTCGDSHLYAFYSNGTMKWKYKLISNCTYSSPAIANDGTIYIGDHYSYLYAIYPDGILRWKVQLQSNYYKIPSGPSVADDGTIYVATYNTTKTEKGYLFAVNPKNGAVKWKYKIGSDFYVNPSIGEDGTIYILDRITKYGTNNPPTSKLHAIKPDGTKKWIRDIGYLGYNNRYSDPAISEDGTIYVAVNNRFIAFNPYGTKKWCKKFDIPYLSVESSPVIGNDGTIYLGLSHYREIEPLWYYDGTPYLHAFNERDLDAPSAPEISGPALGMFGEYYNYTIVSTDPNGDDIYYCVSWGEPSYDFPMTPWIPSVFEEFGPYPSGEEITINHSWITRGIFNIKVIARDTNNLVGTWGSLKVIMSRTRASSYHWFLERFPLLERLLGLIK
jgi:outer membrane protein assembly factor BamB